MNFTFDLSQAMSIILFYTDRVQFFGFTLTSIIVALFQFTFSIVIIRAVIRAVNPQAQFDIVEDGASAFGVSFGMNDVSDNGSATVGRDLNNELGIGRPSRGQNKLD
jgi:hypothetical protein